MKGLGTDETTLIDVLCKRTFAQRDEIARVFKTSYGKDLLRELESETSFKFKKLLKALMLHPAYYEAHNVRSSVKGYFCFFS
jgi:hypothetical protein